MKENSMVVSLLLSIQSALIGEITPNIRGITCDIKDSQIIIRCCFEGQITEEDEESMSCVGSEVIADFPGFGIDTQLITVSDNEFLPDYRLSYWVYKRKEYSVLDKE